MLSYGGEEMTQSISAAPFLHGCLFPMGPDLASLHSLSQPFALLPFDDLKISGKPLLCAD